MVFRIVHSRSVSGVSERMYGGVLLLSGSVRRLPGHNITENKVFAGRPDKSDKGLCIVGDNICVKARCEGQMTNLKKVFLYCWG